MIIISAQYFMKSKDITYLFNFRIGLDKVFKFSYIYIYFSIKNIYFYFIG